MKKVLADTLKTNHECLEFEPSIHYKNYEFGFWNVDGDFNVELPACNYGTVNAVIKDIDTEDKEIIGHVDFCIINAENFEDGLIPWVWESLDDDAMQITIAMHYIDIENNYFKYGFHRPYENFVVVKNIEIDEEWRNMGIATLLMRNLQAILQWSTQQTLPVIIWEAKASSKEERKNLVEIFKKMGAKNIHDMKSDFFFFNEEILKKK